MMKQHYFLFLSGILLLCGLLGSCNLYNPAEPVPSFIHIQDIGLTTDSTIEGTNSSNITDAWVYIDGSLVGAYELPVTLPVLSEGTHELTVKAGIKVNGISATRAPYPFYESYRQSITLTAGNITTVSPMVKYVSEIDWDDQDVWLEDFEDISSGMTLDTSASGTDTNMFHRYIAAGTTSPEVYEGRGSGIAYVDHDNDFFEYMSNTSYYLPRGDSPVFLELNYRCNYTFVVGVFAHGTAGSYKTKVLNIHPSLEWKKIYIYLSPTIKASGTATDYTIFFGMLNTAAADGFYMAIDNIKLIHY
jgi:hypothetical protein